jgi:K+-transporting ATPase KdpF subunit
MANTLIEYILVGIVTLALTVYLVIALLAPEKF